MRLFQSPRTDRNPGTAAILSFFFMGLGQAYNGEMVKAVAFLILYALSTLLTCIVIGFITTPVVWIWSVVDAYRSSQKINRAAVSKQSPSNAITPGLVFHAP